MSIYRGAGGSGDATNDATVSQVQTYASQAATSATNAASSATAAAASASGASTSAALATSAKNDSQAIATTVAGYVAGALASETAADVSATEAAASAAAAAISEGGASGSASDALDSANTATTQASNAATSATNSANSAASALAIYGNTTAMNTAVTNAGNSATSAATSATNAATSASNASSSASAASSSASAASTSASAAATSAGNAATSASNASSSASAASSSASSASTSASTATTQASNAATSATNASNSASTATTQAGIATTGGTTATTQAGIATTQAGIATTGATTATTQAGIATTQATNASTSATNASSSETNSLANRNAAATSATAASTSASAAATSATSSATSASAAATSAAAASAVALGNEPVRHSVRPSLLLDFANTKQLDPRITFTRASTATFYDGRTTAKAEENLVTYSQGIGSTGWAAVAITSTQNTTTAPDGTTTASKISEDATNNVHSYGQTITTVSALTYTVSFFLKSSERTFSALQVNTGSSAAWVSFDLSTGAVGTITTLAGAGLPASTASALSVGNGWYRCTLIFTASGTSTTVFIGTALDATTRSYTGTTGNGIFTWGAQFEQRSAVTAYTPTTTAAITNYIPALQTAASGVARFDHNPTTGESLGLLIEEQRVNVVLRSEDFTTTWGLSSATVNSNTIIAPDGTLTGDKLIEAAAAGLEHLIEQQVSITTNQTYTQSIYVKGAETTSFALMVVAVGSSATTSIANFNISAGVITTGGIGGGIITSSSATSVGNGWYRCAIVYTLNGTVTSHRMRIYPRQAGTYTGDGFSGIYIWGAQLEAGAFATSYIPTVASQVTRSADAATMTGTNFTSWFNQNEGTLYAERENVTTTGIRPLACFFNTGNNYMAFYRSSGITSTEIVTNGTTTGSVQITSAAKASFSYLTNNINAAVGGTIGTTDTSCLVPVITFFEIGSIYNNLYKINGCLKKIAYYPKQLTNAELQSLTIL
jgi:hypothetical protein